MDYSKYAFIITLMFFSMILNTSCKNKNDQDWTIDLIAEDLASDYTELTQLLIIETPKELRGRLFSMELSITVNNRYGLKSEGYASNRLREECFDLTPNANEEHLEDSCITVIIEKSFEKVISEVDFEVMQKINHQSSILRSTYLGESSDKFTQDIHIDDAVSIINSVLEAHNKDLELKVSGEVVFRSMNIDSVNQLSRIMPGRKDVHPDTIMDAIHQIVYLSGSCLRQSPSLVWIGSDCNEFSPAENW